MAWFPPETLNAAISKPKAEGSTARTVTWISRADLITTIGDSHRLAEALAGKGVTPCTDPTPRNPTGHRRGFLMRTWTSNDHPPGHLHDR